MSSDIVGDAPDRISTLRDALAAAEREVATLRRACHDAGAKLAKLNKALEVFREREASRVNH